MPTASDRDPAAVKSPSRIYLTGFMGSGKTTAGRLLARSLDYRFVDLDAYVEEHAGRSIPTIFEEDGEGGFRRLEREALEKTTLMDEVVVATGGGALTMPGAMDLAKSAGTVIYLAARAETIIHRTQAEAAARPLLADNAHDLYAYVTSLLNQRRPKYEQAHVTIDVDDLQPQAVVAEIKRYLRGRA